MMNVDGIFNLSSVIAGLSGSIATIIVFFFKEQYSKFSMTKTLAASLLAEITCIEENYRSLTNGGLCRNPGEITLLRLSMEEEYFVVFNNNTDKIGLFDSTDAKTIIHFYIKAKSFNDTLRVYSNEGMKHDVFAHLWNAAVENEQTELVAKQMEIPIDRMVPLYQKLLIDEDTLKVDYDICVNVLEKYAKKGLVDFIKGFKINK